MTEPRCPRGTVLAVGIKALATGLFVPAMALLVERVPPAVAAGAAVLGLIATLGMPTETPR